MKDRRRLLRGRLLAWLGLRMRKDEVGGFVVGMTDVGELTGECNLSVNRRRRIDEEEEGK